MSWKECLKQTRFDNFRQGGWVWTSIHYVHYKILLFKLQCISDLLYNTESVTRWLSSIERTTKTIMMSWKEGLQQTRFDNFRLGGWGWSACQLAGLDLGNRVAERLGHSSTIPWVDTRLFYPWHYLYSAVAMLIPSHVF